MKNFDIHAAQSALISAAGWIRLLENGQTSVLGSPTTDFILSDISSAAFFLGANASESQDKDALEAAEKAANAVISKYNGHEVSLPI